MKNQVRIVSTKKLQANQKQYLLNANFSVVEADFIKIKLKKFTYKSKFQNLIFSSQNAVESILKNTKLELLRSKKCFCVGQKTKTALEDLWDYTSELFIPSETEIKAAELGFGADISLIKPLWEQKVNAILTEATLLYPETKVTQKGGKTGLHSEHLGFVLAEMQFLQRAYPGAEW